MKIATCTLFLTSAVFFNFIELSSQGWNIRKREKISLEPEIRVTMRSYLDATDQERTLPNEKKVTFGIRKLRGTDHIIGIVINGVICPMLNENRRMFVLKMDPPTVHVLQTTNGVPYGFEPEHTVEGIAVLPKPQTPRQSPRPSTVASTSSASLSASSSASSSGHQ